MFYTVYRITNKINNKTYHGMHKTKRLDDGYMGSGKVIKRAIEKHGVESFQKDILFVFETKEEMALKEAEIVNPEYLASGMTYNLKEGGRGGFDYVNSVVTIEQRRTAGLKGTVILKKMMEDDPDFRRKMEEFWRISRSKAKNPHRIFSQEHRLLGVLNAQSQEARDKRAKTKQERGVQQGEKNSQYGSRFVTDGILTKRISKAEEIPDGWVLGTKASLEKQEQKRQRQKLREQEKQHRKANPLPPRKKPYTPHPRQQVPYPRVYGPYFSKKGFWNVDVHFSLLKRTILRVDSFNHLVETDERFQGLSKVGIPNHSGQSDTCFLTHQQ